MQVDLVLEMTIPPIGESIGVILQMVMELLKVVHLDLQFITKMDWLLEILPEVHHIVMQPINLMYTENFGMVGIKWVIVILSNLNHG